MNAAGAMANAPAFSAESTQAGDALIHLLAQGLGCAASGGPIEHAAWPGIVEHAVRTKTAGLLAESARRAGCDLPQAVRRQLAEIQAEKLRSNLANLAWTIKAAQVLEAEGVPAIAFKGAIRAHEVYGRWDARASSDIDLLVHEGDYWKACGLLDAAGFKPLVSPASQWWHRHLGEAPFARTDGSGAVVDLHNSLQQPGGPFPARLEDFWAEGIMKPFGNAQLRTPSPRHSLLICAISYGKAVRSGSPWLAHAHELALATSAMSGAEAEAIRALAREQGLLRLYDDAVASAKLLFSQGAGTDETRGKLLLSALGQGHKDRFSRTKWLWDWCDGEGARRGANFTGAIWRICRRDARQFVENLTKQNRLRIPSDG